MTVLKGRIESLLGTPLLWLWLFAVDRSRMLER
jgi:hypothetical protein